MTVKGLLERRELRPGPQAFDRLYLASPSLHRQHQARPDCSPVDENGACAANAVFATELRPGQLQLLSKEVGERDPRFDLPLDLPAVHRQLDCQHFRGNLAHRSLLPASSTARRTSVAATRFR